MFLVWVSKIDFKKVMINSIRLITKSLYSNGGIIKYLKNTSWLFVEKILRMAVSLFVGVWVTRYLGPKQFGEYSYAISFVSFFLIIASLGLNEVLVREFVKNKKNHSDFIITVFWTKFITAIGVIGLLFFVVGFTSNTTTVNTCLLYTSPSPRDA